MGDILRLFIPNAQLSCSFCHLTVSDAATLMYALFDHLQALLRVWSTEQP